MDVERIMPTNGLVEFEREHLLRTNIIAWLTHSIYLFALFFLSNQNTKINLPSRFKKFLDAWNAPFVGTHGSNPENDS